MPDGARPHHGRIGPNAVLQLLAVLDAVEPGLSARLLVAAGLSGPPPDTGLMDEAAAAALHRLIRATRPDAAALLSRAGWATGDYILAHRIPQPVAAMLRALPTGLAAPILARAIARHAWTFAGSGHFAIIGRHPLIFEMSENPLIRGEMANLPLCHWHAAVFTRLFSALVSRRARMDETACAAMGAPACRFEYSLCP